MSSVGKLLVIAGIAVWPAWGALALIGRAPNVIWAVAVHLLLVVPGGLIMRSAHAPTVDPALLRKRRLGSALLLTGVLAWAPYIYLKNYEGTNVDSTPFLFAHLAGVLPGAVLRYLGMRKGSP